MSNGRSGLSAAKTLVDTLRAALYDFDEVQSRSVIEEVFADEAIFHLCHPLGDLQNPQAFYEQAIQPLHRALPDMERRDYIRIAGTTSQGQLWVGCGGFYSGVFVRPWLDIPPTGHLVSMRFHEFYRIDNNAIVEMQALWDIPDVMRQAGAWPMAPSLGREWHIPGPATNDGIVDTQGDGQSEELAISAGQEACAKVVAMLEAMKRHPAEGGPEVMQMDKFWHPKMNWYGPSGIGSSRGIAGFRHWHQIPFLSAMPDRGQYVDQITYHFFGEADYVGVTGWPNMIQTLTHDGWMGLVPGNARLEMRSLDFWRLEKGLIRENWVLVDLLDVYRQLGVDVFARLREFNKARPGGCVGWPLPG